MLPHLRVQGYSFLKKNRNITACCHTAVRVPSSPLGINVIKFSHSLVSLTSLGIPMIAIPYGVNEIRLSSCRPSKTRSRRVYCFITCILRRFPYSLHKACCNFREKKKSPRNESSFSLTVKNALNLPDELVFHISELLDSPFSTLRIAHPEQDTSCNRKTDLSDPEPPISTVLNLTPSTFAHGKLLSIVFSRHNRSCKYNEKRRDRENITIPSFATWMQAQVYELSRLRRFPP